jgi:hypothetical protein
MAENGVAQTHPTGGEQPANTLQPTSTSQHRTTPDAKVRSAITPSPLVARRPCLFSHGTDRQCWIYREFVAALT